jgi:hypothetical protein
MIKVESRVVPNTLIEHDFQDAFKNGRSAGNGVYAQKGTTSKMVVTSRSKVCSWQDGNTSTGIYGLPSKMTRHHSL